MRDDRRSLPNMRQPDDGWRGHWRERGERQPDGQPQREGCPLDAAAPRLIGGALAMSGRI